MELVTHVAGMETEDGVRVGGVVIEELVEIFIVVLCGFALAR